MHKCNAQQQAAHAGAASRRHANCLVAQPPQRRQQRSQGTLESQPHAPKRTTNLGLFAPADTTPQRVTAAAKLPRASPGSQACQTGDHCSSRRNDRSTAHTSNGPGACARLQWQAPVHRTCLLLYHGALVTADHACAHQQQGLSSLISAVPLSWLCCKQGLHLTCLYGLWKATASSLHRV